MYCKSFESFVPGNVQTRYKPDENDMSLAQLAQPDTVNSHFRQAMESENKF